MSASWGDQKHPASAQISGAQQVAHCALSKLLPVQAPLARIDQPVADQRRRDVPPMCPFARIRQPLRVLNNRVGYSDTSRGPRRGRISASPVDSLMPLARAKRSTVGADCGGPHPLGGGAHASRELLRSLSRGRNPPGRRRVAQVRAGSHGNCRTMLGEFLEHSSATGGAPAGAARCDEPRTLVRRPWASGSSA